MMWLAYVVIVVVLVFGAYAFAKLAGFQTRMLTRRTDRRAEDLYDAYADPATGQRPSSDPSKPARKPDGDERPEPS
jgi:hypothetical protein